MKGLKCQHSCCSEVCTTEAAEEAPSNIEVYDNSDCMVFYCLAQSTGSPSCASESGGEEGLALCLQFVCECEALLSGERNLSGKRYNIGSIN